MMAILGTHQRLYVNERNEIRRSPRGRRADFVDGFGRSIVRNALALAGDLRHPLLGIEETTFRRMTNAP